jgi:hypothetical protein
MSSQRNKAQILKTFSKKLKTGNPYSRGRLGTIDLLIKIACSVKKKIFISVLKGTDPN